VQYTVQIRRDVIIPEAKHPTDARVQPLVTRCAACAFAVLPTIDFCNPTYEVRHKLTKRMPANKFVTGDGARPQMPPKFMSRIRGIATEPPRKTGISVLAAAHGNAPHPARFARRPLHACGER